MDSELLVRPPHLFNREFPIEGIKVIKNNAVNVTKRILRDDEDAFERFKYSVTNPDEIKNVTLKRYNEVMDPEGRGSQITYDTTEIGEFTENKYLFVKDSIPKFTENQNLSGGKRRRRKTKNRKNKRKQRKSKNR